MKNLYLFIIFCFFLVKASVGQTCDVKVDLLKGKYEGECKNGWANGKGVATGSDSYDGEFKDGQPNGFGKYSWHSGEWYEGLWKKGVMEGKGTMHFVTQTNSDSVVQGFWKKNKYIGQYEKPFEIISTTSKISYANIDKDDASKENQITIVVENTAAGTISIDNIEIKKGAFTRKFDNNYGNRKSTFTLQGVQFPFEANYYIGNERVGARINNEGSWVISIKINN